MVRPAKRYSQAERVLMIYDRMWRGAPVRAVDLAADLGLSRRTCERDLAVLKEVLGPRLVEERRLEHKLYKIPRGIHHAAVSREQVLAYVCGTKVIEFLSGPTFRLDASGLAELLWERLPTPDRIPAARLANKVRVTEVGHKKYAEQPEVQHTLGLMTDALLYERPITVSYLSPKRAAADRAAWTAVVNPLAMVIHRGGVYFVVDIQLDGMTDPRRLLALDRVQVDGFDANGPMFDYPKDFDIDAFFADAFGIFTGSESEEVHLRFPPAYAQYVEERTWHRHQHLSRDEAGWLHLRFPVAGYLEVSDWILGMGANVEVLEPPGLRALTAKRLRDALAVYETV